jgi:hypothetical protein
MVAGDNSSNGVNGINDNHLDKIFVMKKRYLLAALLMAGFSQTFAQKSEQIKLITLDPDISMRPWCKKICFLT